MLIACSSATALGTGGLTMSGNVHFDLNANSITLASLSGTAVTITDNNSTRLERALCLTVNQSARLQASPARWPMRTTRRLALAAPRAVAHSL